MQSARGLLAFAGGGLGKLAELLGPTLRWLCRNVW